MTKRPEEHKPDFRFIAVVLIFLMVLGGFFFMGFLKYGPQEQVEAVEDIYEEIVEPGSPKPEIKYMVIDRPDEIYLDIPQPDPVMNDPAPPPLQPETSEPEDENIPVEEESFYMPPPGATGKVVVIIDDMGMDRKRSRQVVEMPGPLTLAFLPYAPALESITEKARERGHELIIHVPMEPVNPDLDIGPLALKTGMETGEFDAALKEIFQSFKGYAGINNHMGSKLTQDKQAMHRVMRVLQERGLFFIDSKTIHTSVAAETASEHQIPYAERDVFLDHEAGDAFVRKSLKRLEMLAYKNGHAIAIGHPKDATIRELKSWLPGLKKKGLTLVPVSVVVRTPSSGQSFVRFGPAQLPSQPLVQ